MYFFLFKDNLKGYIRIKYIGMMCNGVGVILLRCWWILGSCIVNVLLVCLFYFDCIVYWNYYDLNNFSDVFM